MGNSESCSKEYDNVDFEGDVMFLDVISKEWVPNDDCKGCGKTNYICDGTEKIVNKNFTGTETISVSDIFPNKRVSPGYVIVKDWVRGFRINDTGKEIPFDSMKLISLFMIKSIKVTNTRVTKTPPSNLYNPDISPPSYPSSSPSPPSNLYNPDKSPPSKKSQEKSQEKS